MIPGTYYLHFADGTVQPIVWDGQAQFALPPGASLSAERPAGQPSVVPVPESVSRRQLREWLIDHELFEPVVQILNAIPETKARQKALNWWEEANYDRAHPLVAQLGELLGMTEAQVDAAFIAAANL